MESVDENIENIFVHRNELFQWMELQVDKLLSNSLEEKRFVLFCSLSVILKLFQRQKKMEIKEKVKKKLTYKETARKVFPHPEEILEETFHSLLDNVRHCDEIQSRVNHLLTSLRGKQNQEDPGKWV